MGVEKTSVPRSIPRQPETRSLVEFTRDQGKSLKENLGGSEVHSKSEGPGLRNPKKGGRGIEVSSQD